MQIPGLPPQGVWFWRPRVAPRSPYFPKLNKGCLRDPFKKRCCWKTLSIPWMTRGFRSMSLIARVACANIEMTELLHTCSEMSNTALQAIWEWAEPGGCPHCTLLAPVCCSDRNCHLSAGFCSPQTARARNQDPQCPTRRSTLDWNTCSAVSCL